MNERNGSRSIDPTTIGQSFDIEDLPSIRDAAPSRVMSVSPNEASEQSPMSENKAGSTRTSEAVFLSPRVVDESSFDELATTMRTLVDDADRARGELQQAVDSVRHEHEQPKQAAAQLQERLRLGARMLKAFQAQIERVESTMNDLGDQHQLVERERQQLFERLGEVEATARDAIDQLEEKAVSIGDDSMKAFEKRLEDSAQRGPDPEELNRTLNQQVDAAFTRFEELVARYDPAFLRETDADERIREMIAAAETHLDNYARQRRGEIDRHAEQLGDLHARTTEFIERLESAEVGAAAARHHAEDCSRQVRSDSDAARVIATQCVETKAALSTELRKAQTASDELATRQERLAETFDDQFVRGDALQKQLDRSLKSVDRATHDMDEVSSTCDRLESLLARLEPWQSLLCTAELDEEGLPRSATAMADQLRSGIGEDMQALADTLHGVANRVTGLGLPAATRRVSAATEAKPETTESAEAPEITTARDRRAADDSLLKFRPPR